MSWFQALQAIPSFIHLSLIILSTADARTCYLPNGDIAPNDQPCFPQNPESSCCGGSTYVCSTNNMCAYFDGSYYVVGSCTDKTWNSPACPGYCFFRDHVHNTVFRCSSDTYCCADGPSCNCTTGVNTHDIRDFLPEYSELVGSSVELNTMVATSDLMTPLGATRSAASASVSPTASASQNTMTSITATLDPTIMTTAQTSMAPTSHAETSNVTPIPEVAESESRTDKGLKIGLGVGISLGVIAIILAVLLLVVWRRGKKKQALINTPHTTQFQFPQPEFRKPICELDSKPYGRYSPKVNIYEAPGHEVS